MKQQILVWALLALPLHSAMKLPEVCPARLPLKAPEWGGGSLRIMWFNVENLFHPEDDSVTGDDEFTPGGIRHWSHFRYRQKLTSLAKVIIAAGQWDPPEVIGLCEVENRQVLEELAGHPILAPYGYGLVHVDSPDTRGMDVACLYREKQIGLVGWRPVCSAASGRGEATRQILQVELAWGRDTLDLILLHFISKYSGEGATAVPRREQAEQLVLLVDSMHRNHPGRLKVMAGDFNDPLEAYAMEPVRLATIGGGPIRGIPMGNGPGSYKYRGRWSNIDQFLVCGATGKFGISGAILDLPALLVPDEEYGGVKPYRTYQGYLYNGGISDHLPIVLDLTRSLSSRGARR